MAHRVRDVARPDVFKIADDLVEKFNLDMEAQLKLEDCLPFFRPERFALPYEEGGELALERAFGSQLRQFTAQPNIPLAGVAAFDIPLFGYASWLEFVDRHGVEQAHYLFERAEGGSHIASGTPRVNPITPGQLLPEMTRDLGMIFTRITGRGPSESDFVGVGEACRAVAGTPADFIVTTLKRLGWKYKMSSISGSHHYLIHRYKVGE